VNAACTCGVSYTPKAIRAAEAVKANPEKSDRALAAELGVGKDTVRRARSDVAHDAPPDRVGQDGKSYPAARPTKPRTRDLTAEAIGLLNEIIPLLRQMDQQQRLSFRAAALQRMADAYLDNNEIEF
jgi:hypothetical protein